jgi:hypothetical protein
MDESERLEQILRARAETLKWMQSLTAQMSYLCLLIAAQVELTDAKAASERHTSSNDSHFPQSRDPERRRLEDESRLLRVRAQELVVSTKELMATNQDLVAKAKELLAQSKERRAAREVGNLSAPPNPSLR